MNKHTGVIPGRSEYSISFVNVDLLVCKVSSKAVHDVKELPCLEDKVYVVDVSF